MIVTLGVSFCLWFNTNCYYYAPPTYYATKEIKATITAFNLVEEQTDSSPCYGASGNNLCGRSDVVACPRRFVFLTKVMIDGKVYVCEDRTAEKYDGRFDISFDQDINAAIQFGKQNNYSVFILQPLPEALSLYYRAFTTKNDIPYH